MHSTLQTAAATAATLTSQRPIQMHIFSYIWFATMANNFQHDLMAKCMKFRYCSQHTQSKSI